MRAVCLARRACNRVTHAGTGADARLMVRLQGLRAMASAPQKKLFTPGPLCTSAAVKQAMQVDLGSRDTHFMQVVTEVRNGLLEVGHTSTKDGYECIIMQGSGTMAVEAMLGSVIPRDGRLLILLNGAYSDRQVSICKYYGIAYETIDYKWNEPWRVEDVKQKLAAAANNGTQFTHVAAVHHETTAGVINPLRELGLMLKSEFPALRLCVDSMSSFGAYDVDMGGWNIHFLVSSANKCIEGVPGFSFVLAHRESLLACEGSARSLAFDIHAQYHNMEKTGQFRFTPPTHAMLAYRQALQEWRDEGGVAGRAARYRANYNILVSAMEAMGFKCFVPEEHRGFIITTFMSPENTPAWDFEKFYRGLSDEGFVIYPGKIAGDSFRLANIGQIFPADVENMLACVRRVLTKMGCPPPLS